MGQRLLCLMAKRGAKHLATISRRSVDQRLAVSCSRSWKRCSALQGDVLSEPSMQDAKAALTSQGAPPVRGVIQTVVVMKVGSQDPRGSLGVAPGKPRCNMLTWTRTGEPNRASVLRRLHGRYQGRGRRHTRSARYLCLAQPGLRAVPLVVCRHRGRRKTSSLQRRQRSAGRPRARERGARQAAVDTLPHS